MGCTFDPNNAYRSDNLTVQAHVRIGLRSTPALLTPGGELIPGSVPPMRLAAILDEEARPGMARQWKCAPCARAIRSAWRATRSDKRPRLSPKTRPLHKVRRLAVLANLAANFRASLAGNGARPEPACHRLRAPRSSVRLRL